MVTVELSNSEIQYEAADEALLPQGDSLRATYKSMFEALELPRTYRVTENYAEANVFVSNPKPSIEELQDGYVARAVDKASYWDESWWRKLSSGLEEHGADPAEAWNVSIAQKHILDVVVDDKRISQSVEVYEVGDIEQDRAAVGVVFDTLRLIDQASGGLIFAGPECPRIILGNGVKLEDIDDGGETGGFAGSGIVYLNMPALKELAQGAGANFHELVATSLVHEVLGHDLERNVTGYAGSYFTEHFDYSDKRENGAMFKNLHESVTPKDSSGPKESRPVREYGRRNPAEDFATSVDATVAEAMGWVTATDKMPRMKSEVDSFRRELVLDLMDRAAVMARSYGDVPGFLGSELRYVTDKSGIATGVEPLRKIEVTTIFGQDAVKEEIQRIVDKFRPGKELIVYHNGAS
jgi:hypothetical protein